MQSFDQAVLSIGLMTGTVLDGNIDVALVETDGRTVKSFGAYTLAPYDPDTVESLRDCLKLALDWQFDGPVPDLFAEVQKQLTLEQSNAVQQLIDKCGLSNDEIAVIGFHGQTVLHRPPQRSSAGWVNGQTLQLGDGQLMAQKLGITVVHDFRSADMRAGGQGAPLCSVYHRALLERLSSQGHSAVLNLGGVANLSWWDGKDQLLAFDTGPANAPINDFVRHMGGGDADWGGEYAERGQVDEVKLAQLLEHPYLTASYPKSLDRFDFTWQMAEGMTLNDGAALLTAFSAAAVGKALTLLPQRPDRLVVCGGGRHNPSLMRALSERTSCDVVSAEAVGWRGDAMEAECFAFLAVRTLQGLPTSYPQTTGASDTVCGGQVNHPG
ncbi:MAG: anhydro-N-acetylmuramic acid kinase [Granulosicoccus sp.]|nr:anhydro-N-acetylmuramic acid kinase [Granulosicoccus sp.]